MARKPHPRSAISRAASALGKRSAVANHGKRGTDTVAVLTGAIARGWTQQDVARVAHVRQPTVSRWLSGAAQGPATLQALLAGPPPNPHSTKDRASYPRQNDFGGGFS